MPRQESPDNEGQIHAQESGTAHQNSTEKKRKMLFVNCNITTEDKNREILYM